MKIRGNTIGTTMKPEKTVVKCEKLTEEEKAIARANIGVVPTLVVNIRSYQNDDFDDVTEVSHNSLEIYEHVNAGGSAVLCVRGDEFYVLEGATSYSARFIRTDCGSIDGSRFAHIRNIVIGSNYNVTEFDYELVLEERFDKTIGDIDSALDAVLSIQNELIGGDGV